MKKIYLTLNINVNDECFVNLGSFEKLNVGDIIRQKELILKPYDLEEIRGEVVAEAIIESKNDLLIGAAIKNYQELLTILERIRAEKMNISRIYFDNGKRRNAKIMKYKKDYSLHSKWLDYPPEFVENTYIEFDKKIEEILKHAIINKIEMISI